MQKACAIGRRRPALANATLRTYRYKLAAELDGLLRIIPAHTAGDKLQQAIEGCRRFLFTFLADRAIPPTNNGSEQALRPCHELLPVRMGRAPLCRHPLRHRNRPPPRHRRP